MIETHCPQCNATLKVPSTANGKQVRCPACKTVFVCEAAGESFETSQSRVNPQSAPASSGQPSPPNQGGGLFDGVPESFGGPENAQPSGQANPFLNPPQSAAGSAGSTGYGGNNTGDGNHQGVNPYATTATPPAYGHAENPYQTDRTVYYQVCGAFIALWGGLQLMINVASLGILAMGAAAQPNPDALINAGSGVFAVVIGALFVFGGFCMARRKNLQFSQATAILAAIPCCGCFVVPFGIWACILLFDDRARNDFDQ